MKSVLYIRVSTLDQNPELQRRELEEYARRHEWPVVDVYEDQASGADPRRPALERLLEDARAGKFECVLCWKLDRFGRSLIDLLGNLETLETEMVRFIAVTQGLDTDRKNPASRFFLQVLAAAAEFERSIMRERCTAGLRRYQQDYEQGKVGKTVHSKSGKNQPVGGHRKVLDVKQLVELHEAGMPFSRIAERVGASKATVCRRLQKARGAKFLSQGPLIKRRKPRLAEAAAPTSPPR